MLNPFGCISDGKSVAVTVNAAALLDTRGERNGYSVEYTSLIRTPVKQANLKESQIPSTHAYPVTTSLLLAPMCSFDAYRKAKLER